VICQLAVLLILSIPDTENLLRLLDQWEAVDNSSQPITIPAAECPTLPSDYCPVPVELYGQQRIAGSSNCQLKRWLVPNGCLLPPPFPVLEPLLGRWERQSAKLAISAEARAAFEEFLPHFEAEAAALGDATLGQEVDLMRRILAA
jgi:Ca-activated chloride channel family protein